MQKEQSINDILNQTDASPEVKNRKKLYLAMVLDESTSMGRGYEQTISGFNEQLAAVKQTMTDEVDIEVIVTTFHSSAQIIKEYVNIAEMAELTKADYTPQGCTAMYDGVGLTVKSLLGRDDIDDASTNVLMIILSDGDENMSRNFSQNDVAEMITAVKATERWTITYMGANQDLTSVTAGLNIDAGNTVMFDASDGAGYAAGANMRSLATTSYMKGVMGAAGPNGDAGLVGSSTDFYSSVE